MQPWRDERRASTDDRNDIRRPQPRRAPQDLFGHPRGLTFLFATEMWERFSYYGMRALLVLYMVKYLLQPERAENVIGLATLRTLYESMFGPLGVQPFSSHIYGFYTGLVYLTPVFGGMLADRVLGQHRTVLLGAALMAIGHFMMAFESLFLFALAMLILGNGAFKPNISAQVGGLYAPGDRRRDRAYSIFYVGINLGAFLAPLVCGTLGEELGWHYGFTAAGVGMTIGARHLSLRHAVAAARRAAQGHRGRAERRAARPRASGADARAARAVRADHPVLGDLRAAGQHHRAVGRRLHRPLDQPHRLAGRNPVTWFQAFNPFMIFAFTPFIVALWARQAAARPRAIDRHQDGARLLRRGARQPDHGRRGLAGRRDRTRAGCGCSAISSSSPSASSISPIGLSLVSKVAPTRMVSMMMGVWLATSFTGNFIAGWLGSFWSSMDKMMFFLMIAGIAALAGAAILAFDRPFRPVLKE